MTLFEAIVLGLIQGITEFLPISSSAHLILLPFVLGWEEHGLRFDVVTNAGTLLAAVVYFRHDLVAAGRQMWTSGWHKRVSRGRPGLGLGVLIASVPVLVVGLLFYEWFATVARQPVLIASTSIAFGIVLWWADRVARSRRGIEDLTFSDCVLIGCAEVLALIPGTSRSGITITAGLFLGLGRHSAARFSFLLAIPVGVLALVKDIVDLARGELPAAELAPLAVGFLTAAFSAYLVIGWLLAWLRRQNMTIFVIYRVVLGLVILGLLMVR